MHLATGKTNEEKDMPRQLRMIWYGKDKLPEVDLPDGYSVRSFRDGDEEAYAELLNNKDLGNWTVDRLQSILSNKLSPDGVFFVTYDNALVATACAQGHSDNSGKSIGEVGWVAGESAHSGKGIGMAACTAAVNHLLDLGYEDIYLLTDHWRYPALKTYLKLGFEPRLDGADDRYLWQKACEKLGWELSEPKKARYIKHPTGEEIAWRTLDKENVSEPCILSAWCMKRSFFQSLTHRDNIYAEDSPDIVIEAFIRAGANLCPQFIMPSPAVEHMAYDPFHAALEAKAKPEQKPQQNASSPPKSPSTPEDVRDIVDALPDPAKLERNYNIEAVAEGYANGIKRLNDMSRHEILFISGFGMPSFMGGYGWGYVNYLSALVLYPQIMEKYFAYGGESGRLYNIAVAHAVKKYGLAPYVYTGDDICYNEGPLCSLEMLDKLYFPHLAHAVQPLHDAGIGIVWHSDGNILPIIDRLINDVGVSGFQGFQEETGCSLEKVASHRTRNSKKLILWGSISVTTTLPYGTVDDVKRDVERCFRVAAPGGGFGLASTSSILPETPLENIIAMFEHGQRFGREFLK